MRFASTILPLLCATLVTSRSLSFFEDSQSALTDDTAISVPGKNPLTFCGDPSTYILDIDYVDLDPNPPGPGDTLKIKARGIFSKDVEAGAKVFIQVKYGLITLIKQEADLCDQIGNVDLTCPLKKGPMNLTKEVEIPRQVPKGKYTVMADVYTEDNEKVTCMESVIFF